ncbi:MAG: ABC transporter ATP-binding protein [Burkholderiales bacterium]|jgi:lipopolysaccharide transport system ATP-binding protein
MSSDAISIRASGLGKCHAIYDSPRDRLKQFVLPRLARAVGAEPRRHYREFWALQDVSFEVRRGETFGIVGRNGSGKSTLLQLLCGTLMPSTGEVRTEGRIAALLELGAGFNPEFSGRDNVYMNGQVLGLTREEIDARFDRIAAFADIGDFIEQPVKTYSSGMYVRLAFAVIAHVDADILVVDEALSVGDAYFVQKCMRFLREFMDRGTLLFVSHDTSAVLNLCDRAMFLERGRVRMIDTPKRVTEAYLADLYAETQEVTGAATPDGRTAQAGAEPEEEEYVDVREELVRHSTLRNDLEVFRFDPAAAAFGTGQVRVDAVTLRDGRGRPVSWTVGGETVRLEVRAAADVEVARPIVGFLLKDRLGQVLFGDNTYLTYRESPCRTPAGRTLVASFEFRMPVLPSGDYAISVAVADGTQSDHVQHQWVHEALVIRAHASRVTFGLFAVPMKHIELELA